MHHEIDSRQFSSFAVTSYRFGPKTGLSISVKMPSLHLSRSTCLVRYSMFNRKKSGATMRRTLLILLLMVLPATVGCQQTSISSDDPNYPLYQSQIAAAKRSRSKSKKNSYVEKLKALASFGDSSQQPNASPNVTIGSPDSDYGKR